MKTIVGKVVVLGQQGAGKTSTVTRYVENTFSPQIAPTVGASFFSKKIEFCDKVVKLQIWDTAGQERFKAMAPMFYRNANAAILIYDITSASSFESMKGWVVELRRNVEGAMVLCVLGNKIDLVNKREVSKDEAVSYAKSIGAQYYEVSALTDQGIELAFENMALELLNMLNKGSPTHLRVYDSEDMENIMAASSELEATDVAREEIVNISINSIAHGSSVKPNCCLIF